MARRSSRSRRDLDGGIRCTGPPTRLPRRRRRDHVGGGADSRGRRRTGSRSCCRTARGSPPRGSTSGCSPARRPSAASRSRSSAPTRRPARSRRPRACRSTRPCPSFEGRAPVARARARRRATAAIEATAATDRTARPPGRTTSTTPRPASSRSRAEARRASRSSDRHGRRCGHGSPSRSAWRSSPLVARRRLPRRRGAAVGDDRAAPALRGDRAARVHASRRARTSPPPDAGGARHPGADA